MSAIIFSRRAFLGLEKIGAGKYIDFEYISGSECVECTRGPFGEEILVVWRSQKDYANSVKHFPRVLDLERDMMGTSLVSSLGMIVSAYRVRRRRKKA